MLHFFQLPRSRLVAFLSSWGTRPPTRQKGYLFSHKHFTHTDSAWEELHHTKAKVYKWEKIKLWMLYYWKKIAIKYSFHSKKYNKECP